LLGQADLPSKTTHGPQTYGQYILMSNATYETAPTEFVQVGGVRFAYRRFGRPGDFPLLLLNHLAATLDDWDPLVTKGLACEREVILFDNAGIGSSTGDTPPTVAAMTKDCVDFCRALDLVSFDVMGFSLGGMIAQQLAQDHPATENMRSRV
jgi:pimeloyl-ACP methyl ester carboxylesterase